MSGVKLRTGGLPAGIIVGWPSTNASIPTGFTRATAYDSRFVKMVATSSTAPGATGGSATHADHSFGSHHHPVSHTHSSWPNSGGPSATSAIFPNAGGAGLCASHVHGMGSCAWSGNSGCGPAGNWGSGTAEMATLVVIFIKSDGTAVGIPNNAIAFYNGAAPTGWTAYANGANRSWKGAAAAGDGGGTADTSTHAHSLAHLHSLPAHVHTLYLSGGAGRQQTVGTTTGAHAHSAGSSTSNGSTNSASCSVGSGNGDVTPPWYKVLTVQNTSGVASTPIGIIGIWDQALAGIPGGWQICDGTNGTPNLSNGKFVRGANGSGEVGNTGGATTHTHPGAAHTHTSGGTTHTHTASNANSCGRRCTTVDTGCGCGNGCQIGAHTHSLTATASHADCHGALGSTATGVSGANSSNDPVYTAVAYIQRIS